MFRSLITGLIAGWLAGQLMRGSGYGFFADILLGLVGGVIGGWIFESLNIIAYGMAGRIAMSTVGAVVLVGAVHLLRHP
jgi:uncharacterized membrane protein YeaQ/YmgE (transglycosylase-associated protein family)